MAAYQRARTFGGHDHFGLGRTASLVTDRTKRGKTRAHWAIQTAQATHAFIRIELNLAKSKSKHWSPGCSTA